MNKWIIFLLVFSLAINIAVVGTLVYFWNHAPHRFYPPMMRPDKPPRFMKNLPIPDDKRAEWEKLQQQYALQRMEIGKMIMSYRRQLIDLLIEDAGNTDNIQALIVQIANKQAEMEKITINHLLEMRPMLPPKAWEGLVRRLDARHRAHAGGKWMKKRGQPMRRMMEDKYMNDTNIIF